MMMPTTTPAEVHRVGDAAVARVAETALAFAPPVALLPDWNPAVVDAERARPAAGGVDAAGERLVLSVHTWVVRTARYTVLVDTGVGNGKTRASPAFDRLDTPWLARLAAAGIASEDVTHVLLTHLHTDHVGWNTRRAGEGRWVPSFPNARYVFPRAGRDLFEGPGGRARPNFDMYADSVLPVIEAGQAAMIGAEGGEVLDGFVYHPTPGHSPDHMSIAFRSAGEEALFAGDVVHHPVQVRRPDWNSVFCADAEHARASRLWALEYASERGALWFSSHFAATPAGRVSRTGDGGYRWNPVPGQGGVADRGADGRGEVEETGHFGGADGR